ncbi:MAG TPA: VWA domain-containing protein [Pyrinomonadaceae bacterium]
MLSSVGPLMPLLFRPLKLKRACRSLMRGALILFALSALAGAVYAQEPSAEGAVRPRRAQPQGEQQKDEGYDVLRVETDLVPVDVTVTDAQGKPVRTLRQEDFRLYEDGEERPISFFNVEARSGEERPLALVFALDISGSMTGEELSRLRSALRVFSGLLSERPSLFAVMSFGMNVKTLQPFTADPQKLDRAFARLEREPNGLSTHTYDAVDDAVRLLVRQAPRTRERRLVKRAVLVITDGFPVGDTVAPRTVIERANAADVSVYTVTLPSFSRLLVSTERQPLPTPLEVSGLAEKTGGVNVYANDKDYEPLFRRLAAEVTSAYVLAFYPPEEKRRDGRFHTIKVSAPEGLTVRQSRPGYKSGDR